MKKIIIILIAALSFNQITAQKNLKDITNKVMNLKPSENILKAIGTDFSKYRKSKNDMVFNKHYTVSSEKELLRMFSSIVNARKNGIVASNIWDNFGVGKINTENLVDGRINTDNFFGELPGVGDRDVSVINSQYGNKRKRPGSGYGNNGDMMDPAGGLNNGNNGNMQDGFGNSYKNGNNGNNNSSGGANTGNNSGNGTYNGQMGSDNGRTDTNLGGFGSNSNTHSGGANNDSETAWTVEATHSSYKHSGANGYSSFTHHHSTVSNDKGYSSTTDMQSNRNSDGSSTTRVVVTQTQSDGSSKTVVTTTSTDANGNTHTTRTTTEKNSDGEITNQETEESDNGNNSSCERPDDGYDNPSTPPSNEEKESAVWRAVSEKGFNSGGNRGEHKTETGGSFSQNPELIQNKHGYMEPKVKGGKVNKSIRKTKLIHTIEH